MSEAPKDTKPLDYPFRDVVDAANETINQGGTIYQKFTCSHCGSRQTIDVPNTFYTEGSCQECNHITDLTERGCNYMAMFGSQAPTAREIREEQARSAREVQARGKP